jgi:leucyl/phenylalanyl-tRNA---protein transferase
VPRRRDAFTVTPQLVLQAYAAGIFPMAEGADDPGLFWVEPTRRGILPLDAFHVPARLKRTVRSDRFTVRVDTDFSGVMEGCAAAAPGRRSTWINGEIRRLFSALHASGHAHSVEAWDEGRLVGGLYGVALGGAFFGESMFSTERDASKVALVHLVARLLRGGFTLLDTQFVTKHLAQFGAREVARAAYRERLDAALALRADFHSFGEAAAPGGVAAAPPVPGRVVLEVVRDAG